MPKTHATNPSKDFHKAIRSLIDNEKFGEIFKSTETFVESGGTPLPDTISTILANGDKFLPPSTGFPSQLHYIISLIDEKNFTELTYTSLIKLFTHPAYFNSKGFMGYYEMMKYSGIPVKRRTLAPIFKNISNTNLIMFFYADSKVQNVTLTIDDYLNIFKNMSTCTDSPQFNAIHRMFIQDMAKTVEGPFSMKYLTDFNTAFDYIDSSFPPPHYVVPKKETNKMLEQMRTYITHFYGRNPSTLSNITKGMETLKKMKYTIA